MGFMQLRVRDALYSFVVVPRLSLEGRTRCRHGELAELCTHVSALLILKGTVSARTWRMGSQ